MAGLLSLSSALFTQINERKSTVALFDLGGSEGRKRNRTKELENALSFQYFPETLSDTKAVNYSRKNIPGGSHPLYQWISGGERIISFTAHFSCDTDLVTGEDDNLFDLNKSVTLTN